MPDVWRIRVCLCGCPLGCTMVVLRLRACPDCGRRPFPLEEQTRSVEVQAVESSGVLEGPVTEPPTEPRAT